MPSKKVDRFWINRSNDFLYGDSFMINKLVMSVTCLPNVSCAPFGDPDVDETALIEVMRQRAIAERLRELKPSEWECDPKVLRRFLRSYSHQIEGAMASWKEWVQWRQCKLLAVCFFVFDVVRFSC